MFPCSGSSVELLSRLLKRLDEAKEEIIPDDAQSDSTAADGGSRRANSREDEIRETFKAVRESMVTLRSELLINERKDDKMLQKFQVVARNIDEILTLAKGARKDSSSSTSEPGKGKSSLQHTTIESSLKMLKSIKDEIEKPIELDKESQKEVDETVEEKEEDPEYPLERKIQESSAWTHLKLVVDSFETQLKLCLFCLTVFPPNAVIKRRLLFHWWMGEGIITSTNQGKKCFDKLVDRGFVIPIAERHCRKPHYCKIQTWIRRLLIAVAKSNAFLEYDTSSFPNLDYSRSRRACLRVRQQIPLDVVGDDDANRKLRTIYNVSNRNIDFTDDWLINKEAITTMQLGRWKEKDEEVRRHHIEVKSDKFLDGLGNCRSLIYVSLRGVSRIEKLPDQFDKLTKLVVLDLRACHNLEELPKSVGSARKLQYLDISECYLLDKIPKSISNLSELQVFKGFVVGDIANKNLLQVADLGKLAKLRKLNISTGREFKNEELLSLHELKKLTCLTIIWAVIQWNETEEEEQESGASPEKETTKKPMDDEGPTPADDKKPSASSVRRSKDAEEKKSDQVSSQKDKVPSELSREKKKTQLPVPKITEKEVKKPTTRQITSDDEVIPPSVEKLDLQCYNKEEFPVWIAPEKLPKLKKLYIRGGKLKSLGDGRGRWTVEVLRLRFLDYLEYDLHKPYASFPNIDCVEVFKCRHLNRWTVDWEQEDVEDNPIDVRRYWSRKKDNKLPAGED